MVSLNAGEREALPLDSCSDEDYDAYISTMREREYPMLGTALYLDHAAASLPSRTALDRAHAELTTQLLGNPHSFSASSQRSTALVDQTRLDVLRFFHADPERFDVVFTSNATAAIRLVGEALRDVPGGFWYGYHEDAHTSLVGVRQLASEARCFADDKEVDSWLAEQHPLLTSGVRLFAYPSQANVDGRRLPLRWCRQIEESIADCYTLVDAAAYASNSRLDLRVVEVAPDFTVVSMHKIFGMPDLGALIVKRRSASILSHRKYFGGGTVDMLVAAPRKDGRAGHRTKPTNPHDSLEDGTISFHSIVMLRAAMSSYHDNFGSIDRVAAHTRYLTQSLHRRLAELKHYNGRSVARVHRRESKGVTNCETEGPVVAFNLIDEQGEHIPVSEFEQVALANNVHIRTGTMCGPGSSARYLDLTADELVFNYNAGHRCGSGTGLVNGKPVALIRASIGPMSTMVDIDRFVSLIEAFYIVPEPQCVDLPATLSSDATSDLSIESLTIYPIKSCAGWQVAHGQSWPVSRHGLGWDREWCVVDAVTGKALNQKRFPRMALVRPEIDQERQILRMQGVRASDTKILCVELPLHNDLDRGHGFKTNEVDVCGGACDVEVGQSVEADNFLTQCIGVPCRLARSSALSAHRRLQHPSRDPTQIGDPMHKSLSNESPILTIARASIDRLNEVLKSHGGRAVSAAVFRANIVLGPKHMPGGPGTAEPYDEDLWSRLQIGQVNLQVLGGCQRCQMVCINQTTAARSSEPYSSLSKTRRVAGKVLFGVHCQPVLQGRETAKIAVGDRVVVTRH